MSLLIIFRYGSVFEPAVDLMFRTSKLTSKHKFLDIGCGIGSIVLQAAAWAGCQAAVSVSYISIYNNLSLNIVYLMPILLLSFSSRFSWQLDLFLHLSSLSLRHVYTSIYHEVVYIFETSGSCGKSWQCWWGSETKTQIMRKNQTIARNSLLYGSYCSHAGLDIEFRMGLCMKQTGGVSKRF